MTRKHRIAHRLIWPALTLLVSFGLAMALILRAPSAAESPADVQETHR
jgi:hypothetical protein